MTTIVLEQHFYSSAPIGLRQHRGLQTVARSAGLENEASLEPHCAYRRPAGRKDGPWPVNWGWFFLDEERVCLHRIGYSGTDEVGRPGNFLAHNLVARRAALDAIEFDVPCLLRWVRDLSPLKYSLKSAAADGFVRNHRQLYEVFGQERAKLANVPPLEVPVAEVRRLREEVDRDWSVFLDPLRAILKPEFLSGVLQSFYSPQGASRPLLLLHGGTQEEQAIFEQHLPDFLFALLPYHCRRQLTYCTYESDTQALAVLGTASATQHRQRRVVIAHLPGRDQPAFDRVAWLLGTSQTILPPLTELAGEVVRRLGEPNRWAELRTWRNEVHSIAFQEEWAGLRDGWRLAELGNPVLVTDLEVFLRAVPHCRPGCSWLLGPGARLLVGLPDDAVVPPEQRTSLVRCWIDLFHSRATTLSQSEWAARQAEFTQAFAATFRWALRPDLPELAEEVLAVFARTPMPVSIQSAVLSGFDAALPTSPSAGALQTLVGTWNRLREQFGTAADAVVDAVGYSLQHWLLRTSPAARPNFAPLLQEAALPLLSWNAPVQREALAARLQFLLDTVEVAGLRACGELLIEWLSKNTLPPAMLEELAADPPLWVLRSLSAWARAANEVSSETRRIASIIRNARLLLVYAAGLTPIADRLLHNGLLCWLKNPPRDADELATVRQLYKRETAAALANVLQKSDPRRTDANELLAVQSELLARLGTPLDGDAEQTAAVDAHLSALLTFVLGGRGGVPAVALDRIVSGWLRRYPQPDARHASFHEAAARRAAR